MAELKTKPTTESVDAFLNKVPDKNRREDCFAVVELMKEVTGEEPRMWGPSIVGFGRYRYKYESGREGEWMITGFSPRKGDLTLYIMHGFDGSPGLMEKLGKYKTGKSCLYIKKLDDVNLVVLRKLVEQSVKKMASQRVTS
ncbi:MAG TPA: DUF1801 domain-containing protein [Pyrinomonadaceae bacterium]|nr:DUF1801 domain-containing protein [Pyrinomonadaceae bacterium]